MAVAGGFESGALVRRSVAICGARRVDGTARGFVARIFAVAEEAGACRERNPKRMGEMSQAAFLVKGQSLGFGLALPWGDSEKYDFVVWARPGRLERISFVVPLLTGLIQALPASLRSGLGRRGLPGS